MQLRALTHFVSGRNLYLGGGAGTGKTHTVRAIVDAARAMDKRVSVVSPTNAAALVVGGATMTIHRFFGLPVPVDYASPVCFAELPDAARTRITSLDVLVIDEVSMVSAALFERMVSILSDVQVATGRGVQLVAVGDFCQLQPVAVRGIPASQTDSCRTSDQWRLMFASDCSVILDQVHRQREPELIGFLDRVRVGEWDLSMRALVASRVCEPPPGAVHLYGTNKAVQAHNSAVVDRLRVAGAVEHVFVAEDTVNEGGGGTVEDLRILDDLVIPREIRLCVGSVCMVRANLRPDGPHPVVNGTLGRVVDFTLEAPTAPGAVVARSWEPSGPPNVVVELLSGVRVIIGRHRWGVPRYDADGRFVRDVAFRCQMPVVPAYAMTTHSVQGLTLQCVVCHMGDFFAEGQAYVAISRVGTLDGLFFTNVEEARDAICSKAVRGAVAMEARVGSKRVRPD